MHTERADGVDRTDRRAKRAGRATRLSLTLLGVVLIAPLACFGFLALLLTQGGKPHAATCSEAMGFAGGSMPAEATETVCTDDGGWLDRGYTVEFRMPRAELATRLAAAFPRVRLGTDNATGLSFANAQETDAARPGGQAMFLYLDATYDAGGTARVKLRAFDA
ncbi:hypothetical protein [Streptomyces sp. 1331.2]|uniref:hypothetical protein n=1 Tax=Streptomyces sp. 1331.2 TaxID=1938835 RepID=UPI000BCBABA9|nr:hypothetical protein [Streptomyces sp. 1331.2]SOB83799.1 hypothetical protein SAMN06272789_4014 [Streptomyces sp. 1331.2]